MPLSRAPYEDYTHAPVDPPRVSPAAALTAATNTALYCARASNADLAQLLGALMAELVYARGMRVAAELSYVQGVVESAAAMEMRS